MQIPILIEKVLLAVTLFSGFTYLRRRARVLNPEAQMPTILWGIFGLLPILLVIEAKFLPWLPLKGYPLLALKIALLVFTFWGIGRWVLTPKPHPLPSEN